MEADNSLNKNNPPYTISDIRSTLAYMMEDGYNDRFTFTDNGIVIEVYDEHLSKRVLTCEYVDGHYIMSTFPDTDTDDRCILKDGPDDQSPWVQLNKWLDVYDTEYPVTDKQYIEYLENKVEKVNKQLNDEHCKLVVAEIERDTLKEKESKYKLSIKRKVELAQVLVKDITYLEKQLESGDYVKELETRINVLNTENERLKSIVDKCIEHSFKDTSNVTRPPVYGEFTMWSLGYCSHRVVLVKLLVPANAKRVYMGSDAWWSIRVSEAVVKGYYSSKCLDVPEEISIIDETPQSAGLVKGVFKYPMNSLVKPYYEFKEDGKMQDGACIPGWVRFEDAMWFSHL